MEKPAEYFYLMGLLPSIILPGSCSNQNTIALLYPLLQMFLALHLSLGPDFNILPILFSFPKGTAAGPSGLRVQHLIDAAQIPLPISIGSSLRDIVNLLAAGKAPLSVARFLAGGSLTALNKFKDGSPPDIRPIAVGETLRRLTGKCLCSLVKDKVSSFFEPHQFGVVCSYGTEKVVHGLRKCIEEHWGDEDFCCPESRYEKCFQPYFQAGSSI